MKTSRGIYYDLYESNYIFDYEDITFYFSSNLYLNKFKERYIKYLREETLKLSNKYRCTIICDYMVLINLYKSIEKRGYRVLYKNKELDLTPYYTIKVGV